MNKNIFFTVLFLSVSVLFFSFKNAAKNDAVSTTQIKVTPISYKLPVKSTLYQTLQLQKAGLAKETFEYALKGYKKLVENGTAQNQQYLSIVDLDQSSRKRRFYLLDMKNRQLILNTFVAHGKNSGLDEALKFSNNPNSEASSLGFYVTKNTYTGKHGVSLRLAGLENGFNDKAEQRGIVVHGASYVNKERAESDFMGRSQGCPALPETEYAQVINLIKDGSILFIYHSSGDYLQQSDLLK